MPRCTTAMLTLALLTACSPRDQIYVDLEAPAGDKVQDPTHLEILMDAADILGHEVVVDDHSGIKVWLRPESRGYSIGRLFTFSPCHHMIVSDLRGDILAHELGHIYLGSNHTLIDGNLMTSSIYDDNGEVVLLGTDLTDDQRDAIDDAVRAHNDLCPVI